MYKCKIPIPYRRHYWKNYFLVLSLLILASSCKIAVAGDDRTTYRILHVMSYHSPWKWTDDQWRGFKEAFAVRAVEYKVFQMDTKRHSHEGWKVQKGRDVRQLIDDWKPHLVYANDDNAQQYVTRHYLNSNIPFVFSGVNAAPETYGFENADNISGVLEHEHSIQTLRLLRQLDPAIRRLAIVVDEGPTWPKVLKRLRERLIEMPDIEVVSWDLIKTFDEYKKKVMAYQNTVDAIGILGIFNFKDAKGHNVSYKRVLRWTAENSQLPDFSFWLDRVSHGTLCAVGVSGYEQGRTAGRIAYEILVDGVKPADIPMKPTKRGEPWVSLARARSLGLPVKSTPLLTSRVITEFSWNK